MKIDLQHFAEQTNEPQPSEPDNSANNPDDTQGDDKTVNVEEMKRRLAKEQEKYEQQINDLKESQQNAIEEAREQAKKEAQMSSEELQQYKEQEAQRKLEEKDAEIERLKQEHTKRESKDQAVNTLSEKKLPISDKVLNFVVKDTAEDTLQAIDDFADLLKEQKNQYAASEPPTQSGGNGSQQTQSKGDIFRNANILDD